MMSRAQQAEVASAPVSCRGSLERAYTGSSRAAAIKAMCLRCVGYARSDVRACTSQACPLWTHRPFQDGQEDEGGSETEGNPAQKAAPGATEPGAPSTSQ